MMHAPRCRRAIAGVQEYDAECGLVFGIYYRVGAFLPAAAFPTVPATISALHQLGADLFIFERTIRLRENIARQREIWFNAVSDVDPAE